MGLCWLVSFSAHACHLHYNHACTVGWAPPACRCPWAVRQGFSFPLVASVPILGFVCHSSKQLSRFALNSSSFYERQKNDSTVHEGVGALSIKRSPCACNFCLIMEWSFISLLEERKNARCTGINLSSAGPLQLLTYILLVLSYLNYFCIKIRTSNSTTRKASTSVVV